MAHHHHDWAPAAPIDPEDDPGNVRAQIGHQYPKTEDYACSCGAQRTDLFTNGHRNTYITRSTGRLWRGRRRAVRES